MPKLQHLKAEPRHEAFYKTVMDATEECGLQDREAVALLGLILGRFIAVAKIYGNEKDYETVLQTVIHNVTQAIGDAPELAKAFASPVKLPDTTSPATPGSSSTKKP